MACCRISYALCQRVSFLNAPILFPPSSFSLFSLEKDSVCLLRSSSLPFFYFLLILFSRIIVREERICVRGETRPPLTSLIGRKWFRSTMIGLARANFYFALFFLSNQLFESVVFISNSIFRSNSTLCLLTFHLRQCIDIICIRKNPWRRRKEGKKEGRRTMIVSSDLIARDPRVSSRFNFSEKRTHSPRFFRRAGLRIMR